MSAGASSWVDTPSFCMVKAPNPKNRILPLRSSTEVISSRNQPEASGASSEQNTE